MRALLLLVLLCTIVRAEESLTPLPEKSRLALSEDWTSGKIDPAKWYVPRKKWGNGNNGVVPENVFIARDKVGEHDQNVLVCEAHGDLYNGEVIGYGGAKTRVGGVIVSKEFFASGRIEIVMKIGGLKTHDGGPADPRLPKGCIPALWVYGYRFVEVPKQRMNDFVAESPLYNPLMPRYGTSVNEYWSELDFPEFGKKGDFSKALYNSFLQTWEDSRPMDVGTTADGSYHTFVTEWRTKLERLPGVSDAHVSQLGGYWCIKDKSVPFAKYVGNPLQRIGKDEYAVYCGEKAVHWIDGKKIGENLKCIPAMAAQLNIGVWLPDWAGPAEWKTAQVSIASVKVWQFDDAGDVRGIIVDSLKDNFDKAGNVVK